MPSSRHKLRTLVSAAAHAGVRLSHSVFSSKVCDCFLLQPALRVESLKSYFIFWCNGLLRGPVDLREQSLSCSPPRVINLAAPASRTVILFLRSQVYSYDSRRPPEDLQLLPIRAKIAGASVIVSRSFGVPATFILLRGIENFSRSSNNKSLLGLWATAQYVGYQTL